MKASLLDSVRGGLSFLACSQTRNDQPLRPKCEWQMPAARTSTSTSPGPGLFFSTSSSRSG